MGDKNIRVDEDVWKLVSHRATDDGTSVKAVTEQALREFVTKGQAAQRAVDEIVTAHADDPTQWGPPTQVPATLKRRRDTNRTTVSTADEPAERVTSPVTPERFGEAFEAAGHAEEAGPPVVPTSKPMTSIRDVAAAIRTARMDPPEKWGEMTDGSGEPGDDYLRPKLLVRCKNGLCGHEQGKHREGTGPCLLMACPCARFRL